MRSSPFNIPWGSYVYAKVIAVNIIGDSPISPISNGALILTVPDAPVDLTNVI